MTILRAEGRGLYGFVLLVLLFGAGTLASFAMAPYHVWPFLAVGLSLLYALLSHAKNGFHVLVAGWAFGFGYFTFGLSWIGNALLVEGNDFAWAWPLAVAALPAALAFFPAVACVAAVRIFDLRRAGGWLGFCALLALSEWLRGILFTGFPWNLFGYAWGDTLPVLQILWAGDIYLLSLLTILLCTAPGLWFVAEEKGRAAVAGLAMLGLFAALYAYGMHRLAANPGAFAEDVNVLLIQPNIAQEEKWDSRKMGDHLDKTVQLSYSDGRATVGETTLIVWPETALHYSALKEGYERDSLAAMLRSYGGTAYLIAGALLKDGKTYGNSIAVLDENVAMVGRYDKFHLVPFGEYIPLQKWIPLETVTRFSGFAPGPGPRTLSIPMNGDEFRFSPLVCYEILFPGQVADRTTKPEAIVNVTNDAWYGISAGPHQHLLKARVRAVEEGIPVLRAANTGFSAMFDPYGRLLIKSGLFEEARLSAKLPKAIDRGRKEIVFIIKPYIFYLGILSLFGAALLFGRNNTRFKK